MRYLEQLNDAQREKAIAELFRFEIPCIVVTTNNAVGDYFIRAATVREIPVFVTPFETTKFIYFLSDFLDDQFSPQVVIHGSFVDVYGVGVLLMGRSGIGKSEIALDLVERGHRLVADDVVMITRKGEGILMGAGTDLVKHFMEIRGLGLIDVRTTRLLAASFPARYIKMMNAKKTRPEMILAINTTGVDGIKCRSKRVVHVTKGGQSFPM